MWFRCVGSEGIQSGAQQAYELSCGNISNSMSGWERQKLGILSWLLSWRMKRNRIEEVHMAFKQSIGNRVSRYSEMAAVRLWEVFCTDQRRCRGIYSTSVSVKWHCLCAMLCGMTSALITKINAEHEQRQLMCQTPTVWSHVPFSWEAFYTPASPSSNVKGPL